MRRGAWPPAYRAPGPRNIPQLSSLPYRDAWQVIRPMDYQFEEDPEPLFEVQEEDPRREAPPEDEHQFGPLEYQGPAAEQCPRPLQYAVALACLHLFSGARRQGDVQDELERVLMSGP
eukprot:6013295-Pyramimonas_sp.AAC.1